MKKSLANIFYYPLYWLLRGLVALRYRLHIRGMKELLEHQWKYPGGILFLPNHSAEMDPLILMMVLWRHFRPRPLAIEHFYYQKGLRFFMDLVGSLPLPTVDTANQWKIKQIEKLKKKILELLKEKENFLIYPSGKLKLTPDEKIGGASFVHDLLSTNPELNIVLIRTTGLWGSMFSRALTVNTPDFGKALGKGLKLILKNGIFFAPRRDVTIDIEIAPQDFPYKAVRLDLNKYLETWYNRYPQPGPEPLKIVSYLFWKEELPQIEKSSNQQEEQKNIAIPQEVEKNVLSYLSKLCRRPEDQIQRNMNLSQDLGLDSLDIANVYVFLEERFSIPPFSPGELQSVNDVMLAAAGMKKPSAEAQEEAKHRPKWPEEASRLIPEMPKEARSLQEAFLLTCARMQNSVACMDAQVGPLSYKRLKRAILVLSLQIREMQGEKIGILLPSVVGAYVVILATLFAKKVPVMLNWTVGSRAIEHAASVTELKTVLSSYRFLSRLESADLGNVDDLVLFLEEIRLKISLKKKIHGLLLSFLSPKLLLKFLKLSDLSEQDLGVILFTSGTETLPKGVPLTHQNLLSNHRAAISCVSFQTQDILYAILPPFHSFGFSVTGILPLLIGMKVAYAPDPTDSRGMANDIAHWKPTLFCSAPSFIKGLFRVAGKDQLQSIRLFVSGAEKAPEDLFEYVRNLGPNKKMLEGYGISECSPIVTLDRPDKEHKGVGQPIPGVELCVINPETSEILKAGEEGEICIHGPNVFKGYLGVNLSPFIELQGKHWYRSGDRGRLDADGTLFITGRLKRFVKIGAEMVSLGGLEEELLKLCIQKNWTSIKDDKPPLAVTVIGKESDKPQILLFTTFDISREQVNDLLKEGGWGRLVKIGEIRKIPEIPLTGTGKTHYRRLDEMASQQT